VKANEHEVNARLMRDCATEGCERTAYHSEAEAREIDTEHCDRHDTPRERRARQKALAAAIKAEKDAGRWP
jgi:hypothetical protein